jgi:large exoprotein involved in heme utilization and adhesion
LINPSGIIFGEKAKLDIGGSFFATSANSLKFSDSLEFSATNPLATSLLSINVPLGLQYGINSGDIQVLGANLQLIPGKTLALIGGNVRINGGKILEPSGHVELGGNIALNNKAEVNVQGNNGGSIAINAGTVELTGESTLQAGIGKGLGEVNTQALNIDINVDRDIYFKDGSRVRNTVETEATGRAGNININTGGSLYVTNGALISTSIYGKQASAGNININALGTVVFDGANNAFPSTAGSAVNPGSTGNGGNINITAGSFSLTSGAVLTTFVIGKGNAGNITINAQNDVLLSGIAVREGFPTPSASGIYTGIISRNAEGIGGDIDIKAANLFVKNGARLSARTFGQGDAGNINLNARDTVLFDGVNLRGPSGAFNSVENTGVGNGGNVNITSQTLRVVNGAQLSSSSTGKGTAGNLEINADLISLDNFAAIKADTIGGRGNIDLRAFNLILRQNSSITTNARGANNTGGNIKVHTNNLVAVPKENSNISANSTDFRGGNVIVDTIGLFGLQFRFDSTNMSNITATGANSQLDGTVQINRPEVDPTGGLIELPVNVVDQSQLIAQSCPINKGNVFIITGRGGLAISPSEALRSNQTEEVAWVKNNYSLSSQGYNHVKELPIKTQITEADNWVTNNSGEVILIASTSKSTHGDFITPKICPH